MILDYKDTVTFVEDVPSLDGYATPIAVEEIEVPALFVASNGYTRSSHVAALESDASAYIDPTHEFTQDNAYRLEGKYVLANPFEAEDSKSWYKIIEVNVGQRKLLTNEIDNVEVFFKKSTRPNNVS